MKRLIKDQTFEIDITVHFYKDDIAAASVLDSTNSDFRCFELDILEVCDMHDFELVDEKQSSTKDSASHYYTFVKLNEEGTRLIVYLKLRISDHTIDDDASRSIPQYAKRDQDFVNKLAKKYAEEHFGQPRGYRARRIDIVFNDEAYTSYESALRAIEEDLDRFDPE